MADPLSSRTVGSRDGLKVLFVSVNEEDTSFLTKDVPIKVVHASSPSHVEAHLEQDQYDALVMSVSVPERTQICQLKATHDTAMLLLADTSSLSQAIEVVKQGADGFLLRGVSKPTSLVELTKSAHRCSQSKLRV